ncbi:MAG: D-alanine--D-alanine ligase [Deltaproteobacteria bacterium]|nr:D-alanine--D-alanine ligase [Deltaproteobacteria bacterium]
MRVGILYTPAEPDAPPEDLDGLVQRDAVSEALCELGHDSVPIPFELNLASVRERLLEAALDRVFNLVESVDGQDRLLHLAPALLESMALPHTGAGLLAMLLTTHKPTAKRLLLSAGLPTPEWLDPQCGSPSPCSAPGRVILKSAWEHGSAGLDEESVVALDDPLQMIEKLRAGATTGPFFAERYIEGREFNISVLAGDAGPQVLPPAEMCFDGYRDDKPRVVGYRAKWTTGSFEYERTRRSFEFDKEDRALLERLRELSAASWNAFGLRGYARVDFRVDRDAQPWILEINANPCLSPDAGFAAAAERASIDYPGLVARILRDVG